MMMMSFVLKKIIRTMSSDGLASIQSGSRRQCPESLTNLNLITPFVHTTTTTTRAVCCPPHTAQSSKTPITHAERRAQDSPCPNRNLRSHSRSTICICIAYSCSRLLRILVRSDVKAVMCRPHPHHTTNNKVNLYRHMVLRSAYGDDRGSRCWVYVDK